MITTELSTQQVVRDAHFPALRDHIISSTGLTYYANRSEALAGYVMDRLLQRGLSDCQAYLDVLQDSRHGEEELDLLVELLTIGETHFFRHRELFQALRDVVFPRIIERNQKTKRLRIWSAGCSVGAEPYSLSILLRRDLAHLTSGWNISILGTDINRRFLSQAAEGQYEEWAFRGTQPELRQECFERRAKGWLISSKFREGVSFQYHNLARHQYPSLVNNLFAFDLILCRNVLIYFGSDFIDRLATQMFDSLAPGGWLAVGHAEHCEQFRRVFDLVGCGDVSVYQRPADGGAAANPVQSLVIQDSQAPPTTSRMIAPIKTCSMANVPPPKATQLKKPVSEAAHLDSKASERESQTVETSLETDRIRRLADEGKVEEALCLCKSLIEANRLNPSYYFYEALLLGQANGHASAIESLQRAIYLDRKFALARYYLGITQQKRGKTKEAVKEFEKVLQFLSEHDPTTLLPEGEGMTVSDLEELSRMHINMLEIA